MPQHVAMQVVGRFPLHQLGDHPGSPASGEGQQNLQLPGVILRAPFRPMTAEGNEYEPQAAPRSLSSCLRGSLVVRNTV